MANPLLSESLSKPTPLFFSVRPQLLAVLSVVPLRHLAVCCYRSWSVSSSWYLVLLLSLSRMWCVVRQYHPKHGTPGSVTPSMDQPKLQCLIHSWVQTLAWIHGSQYPRSTSSLSIKKFKHSQNILYSSLLCFERNFSKLQLSQLVFLLMQNDGQEAWIASALSLHPHVHTC